MFTTILVASDGSDSADRLVAVAQSLAKQDRSKVVVTPIADLVFGTAGQRMIRLASCPVLVVPSNN
jgi:nucleotide-binding universal stress UspA family protein